MKSAKIAELRDHLSDYLAKVQRGETVIVYDRDVPVARLEPIPPPEEGLPDFYDRAIRRGILRPSSGWIALLRRGLLAMTWSGDTD
jgi:antitoxin (DNA-binding transcriptional repressor) of toxin-antitoxin stability system